MTDLRPLTMVAPHVKALAESIRELAGDDDLAFVDTMDGETDVIASARSAVRMVHAMEAQQEAAKGIGNRYLARAKDFEDRAARARDALANFMAEIGEKKLILPEATLSLAEGQQSLTGDCDVVALPAHLARTTRVPDRAAIKAELMKGGSVPGYSLSNARPRLQIRVARARPE